MINDDIKNNEKYKNLILVIVLFNLKNYKKNKVLVVLFVNSRVSHPCTFG